MSSLTHPVRSRLVDTAADGSPVSNGDSWVARLKGDADVRDAALEELRDILVRGLTKSMGSRFGGGYQAEDVVQDALIKILERLDQFAERSQFITWAMTVATRTGISAMRRKHYQDISIESFRGDDDSVFEIAIEHDDSSGDAIDRAIMVAKLQSLINETLTKRQRFAIRASLDGMPVEVIAEKTGSNRNSVYKLVHDARVKLRSGLENAGIAAADFAATFA